MTKNDGVWLVRQTQPSSDYYQYTIAVFDNKEDAYKLAIKLNREYGKGCEFNEDWSFYQVDWDNAGDENYHYYDVEWQKLNPSPSDFLLED